MIPIIIPAYEPDESLLLLLEKIKNSGNKSPIIIVNDGSGEQYEHIYESASQKYGCIVLNHSKNLGKGRALKTAFNYCLNEYPECLGCVTADSDGQHTCEDIGKIADCLNNNPDKLILGVRDFNSDKIPWKSSFGNKLTSKVLYVTCGIKLGDTQTGLRGIPKSFMRELLEVKGERFEFETRMLIASKNKYPIEEVVIETIYDSADNHKTHFNPVKDSIRIYTIFFEKSAWIFGLFLVAIAYLVGKRKK